MFLWDGKMPLINDLNEISASSSLERAFDMLGNASLPFSANDITAGSESELQAVVIGDKNSVDLPLTIERSNYFANIARRIAAGDTSKRVIIELESFLNDNDESVWENSWVRFPEHLLSRFAHKTLQADLQADRRNQLGGLRSDLGRFIVRENGENVVRIPVSYLLKLSLAEAIGSQPDLHPAIFTTGIRLMSHFLNDNTSPETFSFHVAVSHRNKSLGRDVAREKSKRFLLSQLLTIYANRRLGLEANGQRAMIYCAPHPPASETAQQRYLRCILPRALYEPVSLRVG